MTPRRAVQLARTIAATYALRVLSHLAPQRWCPPGMTLRISRWSSRTGMAFTAADLRRHQPAPTWTTRTGLAYGERRDALFDLTVPNTPGPHPWVLWVHGGGWHFGDRDYVLPYLELLADRGFAGVAVDYPLAPGAAYPAAPRAVNEALAHVVAHAAAYGLDPDRVVLAGDSAGAQIASEVATLVTNPGFAARTTLSPALRPDQLRGTLLFCGIFDPTQLHDSDRFFSSGLESTMWSLARTRNWRASEACDLMTVHEHVTAAFPPTFLSSGNADALTRRQTVPFAERLRSLGVTLDEFHPGDAAKPVHHEYQFRLDSPEALVALDRTTAFLTRVLTDTVTNSH